MTAATRSIICCSVSGWLGVFASIAVFGVVGLGNCFCGVPSDSLLFQLEAVLSDFINRSSYKRLVHIVRNGIGNQNSNT